MEIRPLLPADDRSRFSSGDQDLDRFFEVYAGQNQYRHHIGVTHVAVEDGVILGFATVAAAGIEVEDLPASRWKHLPRYPLPVLRLARLAVDRGAQGRGIGRALLRHVLLLALEMARKVGCIGVVVDARETAVEFYRKLGFEPLDPIEGRQAGPAPPVPMFLPIGSIPGA